MSVSASESRKNQAWVIAVWCGLKSLFAQAITRLEGRSTKLGSSIFLKSSEQLKNGFPSSVCSRKACNQSSLTLLIFILCVFPIQADAAVQWNAIGTPVFVQPIAIDPNTPDTLYAGTLSGSLLKSLDGGLTWKSVYVGASYASITTIAIDPKTPSTLYMGAGRGGIFKSTNGGNNWVSVNVGLTPGRVDIIAINPKTPSILYMGADTGAVFKSTNGGLNWVVVNAGLTTSNILSIAIDPKTPSTLYVGAGGGGIFKSTDSGLNWKPINTGLSAFKNITAIAIDINNPKLLYAGDWLDGLYKSTNKGLNWASVGAGVFPIHVIPIGSSGSSGYQITSIAISAVSPSIIYVGTVGGMLKSKDNGLNWTIINKGLTSMGIESIAINPLTFSSLYVGTRLGIFKAVDVSINNFTVIDNPASGLDFTVNLSAPLPAGYTLAINFDNQQGGWLLQTDAGGHIPLVKGLNGTTYTLNRTLNKPGLRSYRVGIFDSTGQLVGSYSTYKTCLTKTCLATIERANNIGNPSARGGRLFQNVDVASGNYYFSSSDMSVSGGKGPSFNLTRSYNVLGEKSINSKTGVDNPNPLTAKDLTRPHPWTFAHDMQVRFMNDQSETGLTYNTNRKIVLGPMEDGSLLYYFKGMDQKWYTLTPGNFKQLVQNANSTFTLYSQGDRVYQFADPAGAAKGRLNKVQNRAGLALTYTYSVSNILTGVTDANNHSFTFTHGTNALGSTLRVTDVTGGRFVEYTFDANGMIAQVRNMRGKFYKYTYGTTGSNIYRIATIKDPRNTLKPQITLAYYTVGNYLGKIKSLTDGAANITGFQYGTANVGNPVKTKPATGITRPAVDGLNHNLVYVLDTARSKVIKRIDAKAYAQGFTIASTDIVTTHVYKTAASRNELADNSLVASTDDPKKNRTTIAYDPAVGGGRPQTISNAVVLGVAQRTSTAMYTTIPAQVNLKPVTSVQQSGVPAATQYQTFTPTGKAQDIIDPAGNKTIRAFNLNGQMTQTSNPRQVLNPALGNTNYTYDAAGNVTQIIDALGNKTITSYDVLGRVKTELSPLGLTTTYTYDNNGNVVTRIESGAGGINYKTTNTYDANDNLISTTDPMLLTTNYTYDNMNRKSGESYTVGTVLYTRSYTYDPIGRLETVTNERGLASQTHYTSRSQVDHKVDPFLNTIVTYTYDNNGNVITTTDAMGRKLSTTYDALNRKIHTVSDRLVQGDKLNSQTWTYYPAGQVKSYQDSRGNLTGYEYDAVGNLTGLGYPNDPALRFTTSTYDGNGNVLTVTDPNTHTTTYVYDALDRRISTTLHDGRKWTYTYDANGNMLIEVTPTGEKTVKTYDSINRIASLKEYAANATTVTRNISYTYDANGNVLTEMSGANTIAYTYDAINRIISVIDQNNQTINYGYDKAGNRTTLKYPGNKPIKMITYTYDKNDRLKNLTDWLAQLRHYISQFPYTITNMA